MTRGGGRAVERRQMGQLTADRRRAGDGESSAIARRC